MLFINWLRISFSSQLDINSVIPNDKLQYYHKQILQYQPVGSWPPYDYEPLKKVLQPAYERSKGMSYSKYQFANCLMG